MSDTKHCTRCDGEGRVAMTPYGLEPAYRAHGGDLVMTCGRCGGRGRIDSTAPLPEYESAHREGRAP